MYALFNCRSSEDRIRSDMPLIRELVKMPKSMDMNLSREGNIYRLDAPNEMEAGAILNQLYNTNHYRKGEPFYGEMY